MASSLLFLSSFLQKPLFQASFPRLEVFPKALSVTHTSRGLSGSPRIIRCNADSATTLDDTIRRSANYQRSYWDFNEVQSLKNEYNGSKHKKRQHVLILQVMLKLHEGDSFYNLELIDDLQRLGISYHFDDEIYSILERMHAEICSKSSDLKNQDLYATALVFRLLRQHNLDVSQDIFDHFMDAKGDFDARLCQDTKGLLQLYEASFYLTENEKTLELGKEFAGNHIRAILNDKGSIDPKVQYIVLRTLDTPFHWKMPRLEAREFINLYEEKPDVDPTILELAKLDFNIVQATHISDLQFATKWWRETNLAENLPFCRDRIVENFYWTIGVIFEPQHGYCRRMLAKVNSLLTTIDDVYDVYGTLEELELFTKAVQRWDIEETNQLPEYMKHCYLQLYNSINEMAYVFLQQDGTDISSYLKTSWTNMCRSFLKEAKWFYSGYIPSLQEYLENGWISSAVPVILTHAFFFVTNPVEKEALECLDKHPTIIRCSAMILRLADDLGTSSDEMKRGDVPKSIQCYMNENGASEEEAREHIRFLIEEIWKEMNKEVTKKDTFFTKTFIKIAMNLARMAQCMYQNGDGNGHQDSVTRSRISTLLFQPISLSS